MSDWWAYICDCRPDLQFGERTLLCLDGRGQCLRHPEGPPSTKFRVVHEPGVLLPTMKGTSVMVIPVNVGKV